jgi:integrase
MMKARSRLSAHRSRHDPGLVVISNTDGRASPVSKPSPDSSRLIIYRLALYVLDATGCRVGELERAVVPDLDEHRQGWLVRSTVSKTRQPRLVGLPDDLWQKILDGLPPREDRHEGMTLFPGVTADRLRTAIARACRAAGVPVFSPHDLRHRRISLLHKQGLSLAEVGSLVGQRSKAVTADTYSHVIADYREVERVL